MDVRCPICGEPWDLEELHWVTMREVERLAKELFPITRQMSRKEEQAQERKLRKFLKERRYRVTRDMQLVLDFGDAWRLFQKYGCRVFGCPHNETPDPEAARAAAVLYDILGDDADGAAAMLDELL